MITCISTENGRNITGGALVTLVVLTGASNPGIAIHDVLLARWMVVAKEHARKNGNRILPKDSDFVNQQGEDKIKRSYLLFTRATRDPGRWAST
jgi:hypothetical protein